MGAILMKMAVLLEGFFFRAHAIEDELRKDQCCLAEEQAIENAISLMKKENVVRGK